MRAWVAKKLKLWHFCRFVKIAHNTCTALNYDVTLLQEFKVERNCPYKACCSHIYEFLIFIYSVLTLENVIIQTNHDSEFVKMDSFFLVCWPNHLRIFSSIIEWNFVSHWASASWLDCRTQRPTSNDNGTHSRQVSFGTNDYRIRQVLMYNRSIA